MRHVWLPDVKQKRRRNRKLNINSNEAFERNRGRLKTLHAVFQINCLSCLSVCLILDRFALQHSSTLQTDTQTPSQAASYSLNAPSPRLRPHPTVPLSISTEFKTTKPDDKTKQNNAAAEQVTNKSKASPPTSASIYSWLRSQTTGDCVTLLEAQGAAVRHCLLPVQPMIQPQAQPQPQGLTGGSHHHHHLPGSRGQTRYSRTNSGGGATYQTVFLV